MFSQHSLGAPLVCPHLLCIPGAGEGNQRDVNNQTSFHPELKANVGISICPGPFLHHKPVPSPAISEQNAECIINTSKVRQRTPGSLWSPKIAPQTRGVTARIPCLPPCYITASFGLVQEAAEAPQAPKHGPGSRRSVRTRCAHIHHSCNAVPPKETLPEHTVLTFSSHHIPPCLSLQDPAQHCPRAGIWLSQVGFLT